MSCNPCTDNPTDTGNNKTAGSALFYNYYINDNSGQVFSCKADGTEQRPFSTRSGVITSILGVSCSPRNGKILLTSPVSQSNPQLLIANIDGSEAKFLQNATTDWYPVLSPSGAEVLFSQRIPQGNRSTISVINTDGSNLRRIADNMHNEATPVFSNDGKKVAYYTDMDEIAVVNTDGTGYQVIADNAAGHNDNSSILSWSPDGNEIVFMKQNNVANDFTDIAIANVSTKATRTIYSSSVLTSGQPQWSPDGSKIAYVRGSRGEMNNVHLVVCNADGSNEKVLFSRTNPSLNAMYPQWSPDSKKISITVTNDVDIFDSSYKSVQIVDVNTGNVTLVGNEIIYAFWAY